MDNQDLVLYGGIIIVALVIGLYLLFWYREKRKIKKILQKQGSNTLSLQLQAYERLVLLTERISLPSLITRIPAGDLSARELQAVYIDQIKKEFDHNLSQQIYVTPESWQAVNNLKEQNIFIINQLSQSLPREAKGSELSRKIATLLSSDPKATLHPIVLEALNFEAKKLL